MAIFSRREHNLIHTPSVAISHGQLNFFQQRYLRVIETELENPKMIIVIEGPFRWEGQEFLPYVSVSAAKAATLINIILCTDID